MDDFSIYGDSFDQCLHQLELIREQYAEKSLTLNWEKYYFMVKYEIILGHAISRKGIEVNTIVVHFVQRCLLVLQDVPKMSNDR